MSSPDYAMTVDVVNRKNKPIGKARRVDLLLDKKNFRTVHIILKDTAGNVVLQKLPSDHSRNPQRLGSSVAGYLKAGENYREAAKRKILSELGMLTELKWVSVVRMKDEDSLKYVGVFHGIAHESPRFDPREIEQVLYVSPRVLQNLVIQEPHRFTPTFICIYGKLRSRLF